MQNSQGRVVLLPGLAADERMFARMRAEVQQQCTPIYSRLVTPRLLVPEAREDMSSYAYRTAQELEIREGDIVGGCSFGSMVASSMAAQIPFRGLILLSGALDSTALVHSGRILNHIAPLIPFLWLQRVLSSDWFLRSIFGEADPADIELGRTMLLDTPEPSLRRGGFMAATCRLEADVKAPAFALHGQEDKVINPPALGNCTIVPDAGHGMVVSHPQQVGEFLCDTVGKIDRIHLPE